MILEIPTESFREGSIPVLETTRLHLRAPRLTNPASRRVLEKCGFQWTGAGLLRIRALNSSAPIDRFRLDRGLWKSLKSWGNTIKLS